MDDAPTRTVIESEGDPPELVERIDRIGFGLAAGATIMFFLAFVFAYVYLESLNNNGLWHPSGVDPPTGYGVAITAAFLLSAAAFRFAAGATGRGRAWVPAAGLSLALGLIGCLLQVLEYANLGFGPEDGGYASVFYGWTTLFLVLVLMTMYRVETVFAVGLRNRRNSEYRLASSFMAGAHYWAMLAGIGLLSWVLLYLV